MSMRVVCSSCKATYQVTDDFAGRRFACRTCQAAIQIPDIPVIMPDEPEPPEDRFAPEPSRRRPAGPPPLPPRPPQHSAPPRDSDLPRARLSPMILWGGIGAGSCLVIGLVVLVILLSRPAEPDAFVKKDLPADPPLAGKKDPRPELPEGKLPPPKKEGKEEIRDVVVPDPLPDIKGPDFKKIDLPPAGAGDRPLLALDPGGPTAMVRSAFFHPSGREVITVSEDRTVRRWDVGTGECVHTYRFPMSLGEEGALRAGDISPDGRWIAVAGYPFGGGRLGIPVYLLSLETGNIEATLTGHKDVVTALAFSRSGRWLASGAQDRTCRLSHLETGKTLVLSGHAQGIRRIVFSHDDRLVASASGDRTVRIWSAADGKEVIAIKDFAGEPISVAWHPKEDTLAVGCVDGTVKLFSADGKLTKNIVLDPRDKIQSVAVSFTPDGNELLYGGVSDRGRVGLVNLREGRVRLTFPGHDNTVLDARVSRDGTLAVTTGGDSNETVVWRIADGKVVQTLKGQGSAVFGLAWRLDGGGFAWGQINRDAAIAAAPLEHTFSFDDLQQGPKPDDNYGRVATRFPPWEIKQLDFTRIAILKDGRMLHQFKVDAPNRIYSMSIVPGDRMLVGSAFSLDMVDLNANRVIRSYRGHNGIIMALSPAPDGRCFLSGGTDQTICLWDMNKTEPLATFFPAGNDWIAWTPEGYYACSALGERLMGWQVNHGLNRLASFHPAARFRASLYQPEVIRHLFKDKSLEKALALASKEKPVAPVEVSAILPPAVAVVAPAGDERTVKTPTTQVRVKVRSTGDHPVTSVRLLVDGRPFQGDKGLKRFTPPMKGEMDVTWDVDLLPGKHLLFALAESAVSKSLSPPVEVVRVGAKAEELPNLYLLAVGVSAYPDKKMALQYAHKDATVLEKTLRERHEGVFRKLESKVLTDDKATRAGILEGFAWLEKVAKPADVVIVFLAGHGARDRTGDFRFIPVDLDEKNPDATTVSGQTLKEKLGNLPGRVVIILDACHSGAATKVKTTLTEDLMRDLVSEDTGVVVMCSSQGREFSLESKKLEHGLYTLGLVEGLTGDGDFNKDSYVYMHELNVYAFERVRMLSLGAQNPTLGRPPTLRSFPLAKVGPKR